MQIYALFLSGFNYQIEYKNTKRHTNADSLSRLPLAEPDRQNTIDGEDVFHMSQIEHLPVTSAVIQRETRDNVLARVQDHVTNGWKDTHAYEMLKPFYSSRNEITLYHECLLWGIRVIVSVKLQTQILKHESHPGAVRIKALARRYVWRPGIDCEIEKLVNQHFGCQKNQNMPAITPLHPWE